MLCTPNNVHHYFFAQVCQGIRCALVGGIIVPSMVSPAKPCSTQTCPAQNHFLLGHAHSAQPPPKPCPNLAPLKAIHCSTTPITCSNHAPLLCPNRQPCSNKPCSNLALLKPRPAQHVLLNHPCPTPTSCSNHTPPKPCPNVVPAQSHALLNHAHPLLKPPLCQILP